MPTAEVPAFSGSYAAGDVAFLLKPVRMETIPTPEKQRLIQPGARHYSQMLPDERLPAEPYLALFHHAMDENAERMAADVARLVRALHARATVGEIVLVSLARAGTPLGVLLRRALDRLRPGEAPHYSVSVIRDRGI